MKTFDELERQLDALEREQFERLRAHFHWAPELRECISGTVQFFALDRHRGSGPLPVICALGINYTQGPKTNSGQLIHYSGKRDPFVSRSTGTRRQPRFVIAAYNRNRVAWTSVAAVNPPSPLGVYGSPNALDRLRVTATDPGEIAPCHLIMTNVSPFITLHQWQEQTRRTPQACRTLVNDYSAQHLDELFALWEIRSIYGWDTARSPERSGSGRHSQSSSSAIELPNGYCAATSTPKPTSGTTEPSESRLTDSTTGISKARARPHRWRLNGTPGDALPLANAVLA